MDFPSIDDVRLSLSTLNLKQLEALAIASGVPFTTIYKIKRGETENPGLETLRKFMPHVAAIVAAIPSAPPTPDPARPTLKLTAGAA